MTFMYSCLSKVAGGEHSNLSVIPSQGLFIVHVYIRGGKYFCFIFHHIFVLLWSGQQFEKGAQKKKMSRRGSYKDTSRPFYHCFTPYGCHIIYLGSRESKMQLLFLLILILVLFLKGDINDKNHMVMGAWALISAWKCCCNDMH